MRIRRYAFVATRRRLDGGTVDRPDITTVEADDARRFVTAAGAHRYRARMRRRGWRFVVWSIWLGPIYVDGHGA